MFLPRSQSFTSMSANFHFALSKRLFKLEVASPEMSIPATSLTLSWISPRSFIK